jgi:hypothetical protein
MSTSKAQSVIWQRDNLPESFKHDMAHWQAGRPPNHVQSTKRAMAPAIRKAAAYPGRVPYLPAINGAESLALAMPPDRIGPGGRPAGARHARRRPTFPPSPGAGLSVGSLSNFFQPFVKR